MVTELVTGVLHCEHKFLNFLSTQVGYLRAVTLREKPDFTVKFFTHTKSRFL